MTISEHYKALVDELQSRGEAGCELSMRCLGALGLLANGWSYGDPDPEEDPDDDPDEVKPGTLLDLSAIPAARSSH